MLYCICTHAQHVEALVKLDTYNSQFLPAYPSGHASHVGRPSSSRKHVGLNLERKTKDLNLETISSFHRNENCAVAHKLLN